MLTTTTTTTATVILSYSLNSFVLLLRILLLSLMGNIQRPTSSYRRLIASQRSSVYRLAVSDTKSPNDKTKAIFILEDEDHCAPGVLEGRTRKVRDLQHPQRKPRQLLPHSSRGCETIFIERFTSLVSKGPHVGTARPWMDTGPTFCPVRNRYSVRTILL